MNRLIVCMLCLYATGSFAQGEWQRQYPLAKLDNVVDIALHEDGFGYAVGENNTLLRLQAGSQTWLLAEGPMEGWDLATCDYLEETLGTYVAVGGTGLALSQDQGNSWAIIPDAPTNIREIKIIAPEDVVVVALTGVFRYRNAMWEDLGLPVTNNVADGEILDEDHIWCRTSGINQVIYGTSDGGTMWNANTQLASPDVVRFYDANYGIATDARDVFVTADGGLNWTLIGDRSLFITATDLAFGDSPNVLMVGTSVGDPGITIDSGRTWTRLEVDFYNLQRNFAVAAVSDDVFWMGNDVSSLTLTEDAGLTWSERSGPDRANLHDMFVRSRTEAFAVGTRGKLLHTTNGGSQWNDITFDPSHTYQSIAGMGDALWLGANQRILYSEDDGTTWDERLTLLGGNITDILPLSADVILACSSTGILYRSGDGGFTWDTTWQNPGGNWRNLARVHDQRILALGSPGILQSTDMGQNWTVATIPQGGITYEQAHFIGDEGWMVSTSFTNTMWHTTNGGQNWTPMTLPVNRQWEGVYFISPDTGVVVSRETLEGRAYTTYNGGQTWQAGYVTDFPLLGVTGAPNPNGGIWIHGFGADIEFLPFCSAIPMLAGFEGPTGPCQGDTLVYSVTAQDVDTYFWFTPPGWTIVGNADTSTLTVISGAVGGNVSVTGSNDCGLSNTLNLAVTPTPLPVVTALSGELDPCSGSVVTYSVTASGVDAFTWTLPDGWELVSDENEPEIQVLTGVNPGTVSVTGTNGCGTSAPVEWAAAPAGPPEPISLSGDVSPCPGDTVTFNFEFTGADIYLFLNPGPWVILGSTSTSVDVIVPVSGTLTVIGDNDCGSAELELEVTTETIPEVVTFHNAGTLTLQPNVGIAHQWYLNGAPIPGATEATFVPLVSGAYSAVITFANGCMGTSLPVDVIITSTDEPESMAGIRIYPSPAREQVTVAGIAPPFDYSIWTSMGQPVRAARADLAVIDVSGLVAGYYLMRIEGPEGVVYRPVIIK